MQGKYEVRKSGYGYAAYYTPINSNKATYIGYRRKTKKEALADLDKLKLKAGK